MVKIKTLIKNISLHDIVFLFATIFFFSIIVYCMLKNTIIEGLSDADVEKCYNQVADIGVIKSNQERIENKIEDIKKSVDTTNQRLQDEEEEMKELMDKASNKFNINSD